jgi:hypothetical protein
VIAAGAVSQPMSAARRFGVLSDIGTPSSLDAQQIADQRRTISAFGVGLARGNRFVPRSRPSPGISRQSQVRFRSGHCGDRNGMVPALLAGSLLFYFCQLIRPVSLLVFLLVSATIDDKTVREFR